jgi:uncharacterized protein (DUF983 family)
MLKFALAKKQKMNLFKGTKLYSIFTGSCPVCHSGAMYESPKAYHPSKTLLMHEHCPNCGVKYKIEPSFFYGAMYVSYAVGVAFAVATFIISYFWLSLDRLQTFFAIAAVLVLSLPIILRLSRNIWINIFFNYDPTQVKKTD